MEGMATGADAYMVKPFNTELLKSTIANLLANRKLLKSKFSGAQQQEDKVQKPVSYTHLYYCRCIRLR